MKLYKLTDFDNKTRNDTIWGENVTHTANGEGNKLCTGAFIHAYRHPLIAALMGPFHVPDYTKLWECEGEVIADDGAKVGCKSLTTVKEIMLPELTTEQRVKIAILCAKEVYKEEKWSEWADGWLMGEKSRELAKVNYTIYNVYADLDAACAAAKADYTIYNVYAARDAARSATRAADAAAAANAPNYASAPTYAAIAVGYAAEAEAAADAAAAVNSSFRAACPAKFDLLAVIQRVQATQK